MYATCVIERWKWTYCILKIDEQMLEVKQYNYDLKRLDVLKFTALPF
jgi:hypothetical protein